MGAGSASLASYVKCYPSCFWRSLSKMLREYASTFSLFYSVRALAPTYRNLRKTFLTSCLMDEMLYVMRGTWISSWGLPTCRVLVRLTVRLWVWILRRVFCSCVRSCVSVSAWDRGVSFRMEYYNDGKWWVKWYWWSCWYHACPVSRLEMFMGIEVMIYTEAYPHRICTLD